MLDNDLQPLTPITKENVGLLKAGDWLRGMWDGSLWMFDRLTISPGRMVVRRPYKGTTEEAREEIDAFTYIGPDLGDGWIGWSGGENPVPGMRVDVLAPDGRKLMGVDSDNYGWFAQGFAGDIIAFRPALSPPAEVPFAAEDACLACNSPAPVDWNVVGPKLVEALIEAREALHQHYVDWDGEPEDAVPLQLARAKCDAALAAAHPEGK